MDLSIVIVNWNVKELLAACLASVYASLEGTGLVYEVLVVDNASCDGSAEMVRERFPQVHLLANADNRGFAAANNQALAETSGRCVVLLNPDTILRGDALGTLLRFMDSTPSAGMAGPRLVYPDGRFQHSAFRFPSLAQAFFDFFPLHHRLLESRLNGRYPRSLYASGHPFAIDHPLGACMMVRRQVVEQVGDMDEQFFIYCEEVDWAMRIKRAGWDVYCVPVAEVVHYVGQSTRQFRDEMFVALWRSRFRLFAKHYGPSYNWAVRRIVRLGLWHEAEQARRQAQAGFLSPKELARRLAAYAQVREMTHTSHQSPVPSSQLSATGNRKLETGDLLRPAQGEPRLAVVVLTKNEEGNIRACLQSVGWADKLYVLDSLSTDRTVELARQAGAEVRQRPFANYPDQRNAALEMFAAEWIFFVDADERGTPELGAELRRVIIAGSTVGWWVPRHNYIWGRWIRHAGWYPDYQLRLLKRGFARYDPTREVHEVVILDGPEGHLQNPLIHYNYATVRQFLRRQDFYADYEASILVKQGLRPRLHNLVLQPLREFLRRYVSLQGYKDGGHGLLLSLLMAYYTFVAYWRARRI